MIELTEQQQQHLAERHEYPPRVFNPRTQETFVLLHAEMYERVRAILEEEDDLASIEETYPLVSEVLDAEAQETP
ncbi:MAG: hypothetical protein L0Z62_51170 [Gemmataceae bacterium]|nr:hypothetical protein [Gemmataceae bacterium]